VPVTKRGKHWVMGGRRYSSKKKATNAYQAYLAKKNSKK